MGNEIKGWLVKNRVKILDQGSAGELYSKGYGIKGRKGILLNLYEATYLIEIGWLKVESEKKALNLDELSRLIKKADKLGWTKYIVYRDLRSKGYVVRDGFGRGLDFRVYERGTYGERPARYVVSVFREGDEMKLNKVKGLINLSLKLGKEPILAVVDRRGEVVYYRMFKMGLKF